MVEGPELLGAALEAGAPLEAIYVDSERATSPKVARWRAAASERGIPTFALASGLLERVSTTVTSQPVLAEVRIREHELGVVEGAMLVVVCVDIQDPGNAGALIRITGASGADAVVFSGVSVDPFNPKALRASAGSVFDVPLVVRRSTHEVLARLQAGGLRTLAAVARGGDDYARVDWRAPTAVLLGNEAVGLGREVVEAADSTVSIPMEGRTESLNVAGACAVLCFEAHRQRRRELRGGTAASKRELRGSGVLPVRPCGPPTMQRWPTATARTPR